MGTTPKKVLETNAAFTNAYAEGLAISNLNVRGSDIITLLLTGVSAVTTLTLKFQENENDVFRVESGATVLEEVEHAVADGSNIALRLDVTGLSLLNILIKGNASGTIQEIAVLYEGSKTSTPAFD